MTTMLPRRREAQQLHRLRCLRVDRARDAVREALAATTRAADAVRARERLIRRHRDAIDALERAVVGALAPQLPRWSTLTVAQREALADRLEREEYALIDDQQALEQAQDRLQSMRAELTRALAREDAVRGLVDETRRAHRSWIETRAEREIEDQGPVRRP
jgi:hypothetical protein